MIRSYLYLIRTSWRFAVGRRLTFAVTYLILIIANLILLLEPYAIGQLFNRLQQGGQHTLTNALPWLVFYTLISICFWIGHGIGRVLERETAFYVTKNFREKLFSMVASLPLRWHRDHHSGETHDQVHKSAQALHHFNNSGFQVISTLVKGVASLGVIFWYVPQSGLLAVAILGLVMIVMFKFNKKLTLNRRLINRQEHAVTAKFYDYLSNMRTVITLRMEHLAEREYVSALQYVFPFLRREIRTSETKWFFLSVMVSLTMFAVMLMYIVETLRAGQVILLGNVIALHGYIARFSGAFYSLSGQWEELLAQAIDAQSTLPILTAFQRLQEKRQLTNTSKPWQKIEINGLHFAYQDQQQQTRHLDNVNLTLRKGQKIALVGESGSGKSTLLMLLRGLEPADAQVVVDENYSTHLNYLSDITTLVPQDPEIFESTIEYNITTGQPAAPEAIDRACSLTRFDIVLEKMPAGLKTNAKEKGVNLSGGQKQRLALARGIYAAEHSDILLLDEPTSSLDPANELAIYQSLHRQFADRCIVSSIHRLNLLPLFDYIYVLDQGRAVEEGTLTDLLSKTESRLKNLWLNYTANLSPAPLPNPTV